MFKKVLGSSNDRYIKKLKKTIQKINALEPEMERLSDEDLRARTPWFKERLAKGEMLDDLLVDAFATVREASKRTLGQRHFDVQLIGGIVLHKGQIAEMKTGEGKTLVATLAVYLNALAGKGVHVVTVNDYLARRDADWMGQVYRFLGLTVGCVYHELETAERQNAYACDVTYCTNNELGFDYLRDNMRFSIQEMVQRPFYYAIVDEVDSILIDEARTPLIISGAAEDSSERYRLVDKLMCKIHSEHYEKDEKNKQITFTEVGNVYIEQLLQEAGLIQGGLYDLANVSFVHHTEQALKAHFMFTRDVDYIVKDNKVVIIDEFTGRMMEGRRYSDGLHQALEAKENVTIQAENQTLASITFQNYFRMYPKLAGMTGTAMTEAGELENTYGLRVIEIPTNRPLARDDFNDEIYGTALEKYKAIIREIEKAHAKHQPILVGTASIERSECLAEMLHQRTNLRFEILNAKNHEREAFIIAQAGAPDAVTIATNMAGRGTDIQLGGNVEMRLKEELVGITDEQDINRITKKIKDEVKEGRQIVLEAGGLYVIGTERHENRRIDNQLRGRSGRQGDPGRSKFYVSLEDDLMRIFGAERLKGLLKTFRFKEDEAIKSPLISKAIAKAQQKVESYHFDIRKNLLKYDDVMNDQRKVIYSQRCELLQSKQVSDMVIGMRHQVIEDMALSTMPPKTNAEEWDLKTLQKECNRLLAISLPIEQWVEQDDLSVELMIERICQESDTMIQQKYQDFEKNMVWSLEKSVLLQMLDQSWKEHLQVLSFLKHAIGLRAYGQRDPLNEYKRESFTLFSDMLKTVRERVTFVLTHAQMSVATPEPEQKKPNQIHFLPENIDLSKIGRNDLCPCESGKKFKHCHGSIDFM